MAQAAQPKPHASSTPQRAETAADDSGNTCGINASGSIGAGASIVSAVRAGISIANVHTGTQLHSG